MSFPQPPLVRRWRDRVARLSGPKAVVLMYHRVASGIADPWHLAVSPERFQSQMQMLVERWQPITLELLVDALQRGKVPDRAVVVTFDDGYADNFEAAQPILQHYQLPMTLFVCCNLIDCDHDTWWDALTGLLLETPNLPGELELTIEGKCERFTFSPLGPNRSPESVGLELPWQADPSSRLGTYYRIWQRMRLQPSEQRDESLREIARWIGVDWPSRNTHRLLRLEELKALAASPGVTLGAHSMTHPVLPACSTGRQQAEIRDSAQWLEQQTGRRPTWFAYPYGDGDESVANVLQDAGFDAAFLTTPGTVWKGSHAMALPRLAVENIDGAALDARLRRLFWA